VRKTRIEELPELWKVLKEELQLPVRVQNPLEQKKCGLAAYNIAWGQRIIASTGSFQTAQTTQRCVTGSCKKRGLLRGPAAEADAESSQAAGLLPTAYRL